MDSFKRAQAAYDAMEPLEYWDSGPCDYCRVRDCDYCEDGENADADETEEPD